MTRYLADSDMVRYVLMILPVLLYTSFAKGVDWSCIKAVECLAMRSIESEYVEGESAMSRADLTILGRSHAHHASQGAQVGHAAATAASHHVHQASHIYQDKSFVMLAQVNGWPTFYPPGIPGIPPPIIPPIPGIIAFIMDCMSMPPSPFLAMYSCMTF
jgi:hypothetical protein